MDVGALRWREAKLNEAGGRAHGVERLLGIDDGGTISASMGFN